MKVFITGCAKTGTTLLLKLFHAFSDVKVLDLDNTEMSVYDFASVPDEPGKIIVAKRTRASVMSDQIPDWMADQQVRLLKESGIVTIFCAREKFQVIKGGRVSQSRYMHAYKQFYKYQQELNTIWLCYESLVNDPDRVQNKLIVELSKRLDHKFNEYADFSTYPAFVPSGRFTPKGKNYALREIGAQY